MNEQAVMEFFQSVIGISQSQRTFFTPELMDQISDEFDIPQTKRDEISLTLEVGVNWFIKESNLEALNFERLLKDLYRLEKATRSLTTILDELSPDALEILVRVGEARKINDMPLPRITRSEPSPVLEYTDPLCDNARRTTLSEARAIVFSLGHAADFAREKVKDDRKGRPEKGALVDLLGFGFHVWATTLRRPFRLYWASNGDPITDAAQFCVRIARVVDPSLTLSQIATAARKAREKGMPINNLEELRQVIEHYRKQFK